MPAPWMIDPERPWRQRFNPYNTSKGYRVLPIYYRMVPEFDPDREGKEWYQQTKVQQDDKLWRQEHELDFGAVEGGLVYPEWSVRTHVLYEYLRMSDEWSYQCIIDPGVQVTAAIWQCIIPRHKNNNNEDVGGWVIQFDEYYVGDAVPGSESLSASRHAEAIIRKTQIHCDRILGLTSGGQSRKGGQGWVDVTLMDPTAWRRESGSEDLGSIALRYEEAGMLSLEPASTRDLVGGIERVKQLEEPDARITHPNRIGERPGFPVKYVCPHMKHYIREKLNYKYDKAGFKVVKKKDHLMDTDRMGSVHAQESWVIKKVEKEPVAWKKLQKDMKRKRGTNRNGTTGVREKRIY